MSGAPDDLHPHDYRVLVDAAGFDREGLAARVKALALRAHAEIRSAASKGLRSTRNDYLAGLQLPDLVQAGTSKVIATISLLGALPNMVEQGVDPFDLRETLLRPGSRKLRGPTKRGYFYRYVPFRHSGPDTAGRGGAPMGSQHTGEGAGSLSRAFRGKMDAARARALGRQVKREADKLDPTLSTADPNRKVRYGGRLEGGLAPPLRGRHAGDLFAGMILHLKIYEIAGVSRPAGVQYMTFRTITQDPAADRYDEDETDPSSGKGVSTKNWTHPGITERGFFATTRDTVFEWLRGGDW